MLLCFIQTFIWILQVFCRPPVLSEFRVGLSCRIVDRAPPAALPPLPVHSAEEKEQDLHKAGNGYILTEYYSALYAAGAWRALPFWQIKHLEFKNPPAALYAPSHVLNKMGGEWDQAQPKYFGPFLNQVSSHDRRLSSIYLNI